MKPATDFIRAHNGTVMIGGFPSYLSFFDTVVTSAQAVRPPFSHLRAR